MRVWIEKCGRSSGRCPRMEIVEEVGVGVRSTEVIVVVVGNSYLLKAEVTLRLHMVVASSCLPIIRVALLLRVVADSSYRQLKVEVTLRLHVVVVVVSTTRMPRMYHAAEAVVEEEELQTRTRGSETRVIYRQDCRVRQSQYSDQEETRSIVITIIRVSVHSNRISVENKFLYYSGITGEQLCACSKGITRIDKKPRTPDPIVYT